MHFLSLSPRQAVEMRALTEKNIERGRIIPSSDTQRQTASVYFSHVAFPDLGACVHVPCHHSTGAARLARGDEI
jgi:hypothetical protein